MEKKTGKYLKYAIGEILLVMIGILLALQVNNWNESRKENTKEQQILSQLKEEYEANLLQLEQKIVHREKMIGAATQVLKYIDEPFDVNTDSLNYKLNVMIGSPAFKPIENNLINSGNILLIKNEKLNQLLTTWPSEVLNIQVVEKIWFTKMWETVIPLFSDFGILRDGFYKWWNDEQNLKWILEGTNVNPFQKPKSSKALKTNEILMKKELEGIMSAKYMPKYVARIVSKIIYRDNKKSPNLA